MFIIASVRICIYLLTEYMHKCLKGHMKIYYIYSPAYHLQTFTL